MRLASVQPLRLKHTQLSFDFSLFPGRAVALWGENGSGKSSFFQYLKAERGHLFGPLRVAFLDQNRLSPLGHLRGQELLEFLQEWLGESFCQEFFQRFLCDFPEWKEKLLTPIQQLSGGEAQWLKIMATFFQQADVYILDEPTQQLDGQKRQYLLRLIEERKRTGAAFLITDHQRDFLRQCCEQIWQLQTADGSAQIVPVEEKMDGC